ncbi:MAG: EAL domain-containing protein [Cellvibrionaceae bacterium]|nr:EAL domain-containing protein [Cellvibrionaceae bacterium]
MNNLFSSSNVTVPIDGKSNRRSDYPVRTAIDAIQDLLFDPQAPAKVFTVLLEHMAAITDSDYGVSFLADAAGVQTIDADTASLHAIYSPKSAPFVNAKQLKLWVQQKILPMRPTFFNGPVPKSYRGLLLNAQQIHSIVILPVVSQNSLRAVCVLARSAGDYTGDMVRRLMPLLGSVICALQSADSVKGNILGFDQKITDNRYLSSLLSSSPVAVLVVAPDKTILTSNPCAHDMFYKSPKSSQYTPIEGLAGVAIEALIPEFEDLFQWSNQRARYGEDHPMAGPQVWQDQVAKRLDGSRFIVNLTVFRYTHGSQRVTTLQLQDITALRESADEYQQASQQLNALTDLVPVGIIRVDAGWNCVYANDKWYEFSGLISEETTGQRWINAIHSDDVKTLLEALHEALQLGNDHQQEMRLVSPLGQIRWVDFNTRVLFNESGSVIGFLGTFQDVTERLISQERLRHIAEYDGLTGLANRHLFQNRLEQAFYTSERDGAIVSVLFLDLDGFKDVNDTLGHDVGDLLLQQVAERLLNALRRNDTVARFGGDEFVILLGLNENENVIASVAAKIIEAIGKPYKLNEQEVFVTVSVGIASGSHFNNSPKQILKQADAALYLAKREGKNNFQLFNAHISAQSQQRVRLANQLRYALAGNRYQLRYQPIADVATQEVIGFEALLRFVDDKGVVIAPAEFIPILEETGMMVEAGKWVIEEACKQLKQWQGNGHFPSEGFLSFNVSAKQLLDGSIVDTIINACHTYDINPHSLVMEITETVIITKSQQVEKILARLKAAGMRLAMDDFGTGYSSLSYLQKYPFDHIKVDRSFVEDLLDDENDAKITKAIISLARSLGLKVTAEGVSSHSVLERLKEFGADYCQGYFLGKPVAPKDAVKEINAIVNGDNIVMMDLNKSS